MTVTCPVQALWYALILSALTVISNAAEGHIRDNNGTLEIYYRNIWNILVDDDLDVSTTRVICRTLGRPTYYAKATYGIYYLEDQMYTPVVHANIACIGNETDIDQCQIDYEDQGSIIDYYKINITCSAISLELEGAGKSGGVVLSRWGFFRIPLCVDEYFDRRYASALCRMFGLNSSNALSMDPSLYYHTGLQVAQRIVLNCSKSDAMSQCDIVTPERLQTCAFYEGFYSSRRQVAAVLCTNQAPEYRLTHMTNDSIGRLEVKVNNTWGPVCSEAAGQRFAQVACRSLNLPRFIPIGHQAKNSLFETLNSSDARYYTGLYNSMNVTASLRESYCTGNESRLEDCAYIPWGSQCTDDNYVGLSCENATEGQIRLIGGKLGKQTGLPQVYYNGTWKYVGINRANLEATATVFCRTLNFPTNSVRTVRTYHRVVYDIDCKGNETNLWNCSWVPLDKVNYTLRPTVEIHCDDGDEAVRLANNGLLEARLNGRWGTVCGKRMRNANAAVVCNALNKSSSLATITRRPDNPVMSRPIIYMTTGCTNITGSWRQCYRIEDGSCTHRDDVYIACGELDTSTVKYRLVNGPLPYVGYAEISINNAWGAMTDRGVTHREAGVFCRSAGMRTDGARLLPHDLVHSTNRTKVWLDNVRCRGTEETILDCEHDYPGDYHLGLFDYKAVVYCGPPTTINDFSIRLVGGPDSSSGRLEMMMFGQWGTVCSSTFGMAEASTACQQLNLPDLDAEVDRGTYGKGNQFTWSADFDCSYATSLRHCSYSPVTRGFCTPSEVVGIECKDIPVPTFPTISLSSATRHTIIYSSVSASLSFVSLVFIIAGILVRRRQRTTVNSQVQRTPRTTCHSNYQTQYDNSPPKTQYNYSPPEYSTVVQGKN